MREVIGKIRHLVISCHDFLADRHSGREEMRSRGSVVRFMEENGFEVRTRAADSRDYVRSSCTPPGLTPPLVQPVSVEVLRRFALLVTSAAKRYRRFRQRARINLKSRNTELRLAVDSPENCHSTQTYPVDENCAEQHCLTAGPTGLTVA
jgi:hypothetical protein